MLAVRRNEISQSAKGGLRGLFEAVEIAVHNLADVGNKVGLRHNGFTRLGRRLLALIGEAHAHNLRDDGTGRLTHFLGDNRCPVSVQRAFARSVTEALFLGFREIRGLVLSDGKFLSFVFLKRFVRSPLKLY